MAGKDLIDSVKLSSSITRALGGLPPDGFNYELFLDEKGQKISKSKGNGLTIEDWLGYASPESLSLFMYQRPKEAKKLHFDVIPRAVDEYLAFLDAADRQQAGQDAKALLGNPVWHIHDGHPPAPEMLAAAGGSLSFAMLLNLADGGQQRGYGRPLGLPAPLRARYVAGHPSAPRCAGRLCGGLLPGFRGAGEDLSPA